MDQARTTPLAIDSKPIAIDLSESSGIPSSCEAFSERTHHGDTEDSVVGAEVNAVESMVDSGLSERSDSKKDAASALRASVLQFEGIPQP